MGKLGNLEEKLSCIEKVLEINPENEAAKKTKEKVLEELEM